MLTMTKTLNHSMKISQRPWTNIKIVLHWKVGKKSNKKRLKWGTFGADREVK